jgi:hypothetical protein
MARWLAGRRREAAAGTLHPAYRGGLARVSEWLGNHRAAVDEVRWHRRLAELVEFRQEGHDCPATMTTPRSANTPSGYGSTPKDTNTAGASSIRPGSSF